jgi:hypothetical protein
VLSVLKTGIPLGGYRPWKKAMALELINSSSVLRAYNCELSMSFTDMPLIGAEVVSWVVFPDVDR